MGLKAKIDRWIDELVGRLASWLDRIDVEMADIEAVFDEEDRQQDGSAPAPLGLASCWNGPNAAERMMNVLSPRMTDAKFGKYLAWMKAKGCTAAHVILANGSDGECAGYAGWHDADLPVMLLRARRLRDAGLAVIPWIITDDSAALLRELLKDPETCVGRMRGLLQDAPYVVLGLQMDEGASAGQWAAVRDAIRKWYSGPIGVHHTSGNNFPMASLGDIILGQLNPGCTEAQVKAQIARILALGKRAVGFEYSRGPDRKLALAALRAGAEGVGNWDGGDVPGVADNATAPQAAQAEDAVDFSQLDFRWGGFKGGGAKLDAKARILNLTVKANGMSYKWLAGGCENLGAASRTDKDNTLACLFCLIGGKWQGGKFDWVSTSRTSRDFKNIFDGYGGWEKDAISRASKFAFVIVSKDGARRTNVISCGR